MTLPTINKMLTGDMEKVFDHLFNDWSLPVLELPVAPALDVFEKDGTYFVEMAIPGYKHEDIEVEVNGNILTVLGKYDETIKELDAKYHRREIRRGSFTRSIVLPLEIEPDTVTATVERGLLRICLTPVKPVLNKKITVTEV